MSSSSDRRRAPRVEILDRIHGQIVSVDVPVTVREISIGGLSMQTAVQFPSGAIHEFRLTMGDDSNVLLRGCVVHCREQVEPDGSHTFVSGVKFVDDEPPEGPPAVEGLIDKII